MKAQKTRYKKCKLIAKVIRHPADNPYREAIYQASLLHSNRWGTTSWL